MSEVLHANAVITGSVGSYCLVCDSYFNSKKEAHSHIECSTHWQNLSLYPYLDKFAGQNIRKVKTGGYFCEFCNVFLLTAMKVEFHVAEEEHKQNRGAMLLKPCRVGVMAFNDVYIEERAWHGLISDVCNICDKEVDDENLHKSDVNHVLNLIQNTVKFGANDAIYRQTDATTIQCLTCNVLLPIHTMNQHFTDVDHLSRYASCKSKIDVFASDEKEPIKIKQAASNVSNKISTEKIYNPDTKDDTRKLSKEVNISKILSSVSVYRINDVDVNFEISNAFCRKCCVDVHFDHADIEKHIEDHSKVGRDQSAVRYPVDIDKKTYSTKPEAAAELEETGIILIPVAFKPMTNGYSDISDTDESSVKSEADETILEINNEKCNFADAKLFAKENHLTYYEQNGNAFCQICQVRLPSSLKSMKEHVQGASHNRNASMLKPQTKKEMPTKEKTATKEKTPSSLKKQNMKQFVYSVESLLRVYPEDCLVNRKYCIHQFSFYLVIENSQGLRCLLCEKNINYRPPFYKFEMQAHVDHPSHHLKMEAMPVITSLSSEFIREIRPGSFHCGFCNLVLSGWSEMENHLKCADHDTKKAIQTARLQREIGVRVMSPFGRLFE